MRYRVSLIAAAAISSVPSLAHAHGGLSFGDDHGTLLLWFYGLVLAAIVGVIVRRIYRRSSEEARNPNASARLAELEIALTSNLATLRNAEEYPAECGLTDQERQTRTDTIAKIRRLIDEETRRLTAVREDAQPLAI